MNNPLPFLNAVKNDKILSKTGLFSENFLNVYYFTTRGNKAHMKFVLAV